MCKKEEIYKILEENSKYSISNFGNIKNNKTGRILKAYSSLTTNYTRVDLHNPKKAINVSKAVIRYFGNIENNVDFSIKFKDGNIFNNHIDNLEVIPCLTKVNLETLNDNYNDIQNELKFYKDKELEITNEIIHLKEVINEVIENEAKLKEEYDKYKNEQETIIINLNNKMKDSLHKLQEVENYVNNHKLFITKSKIKKILNMHS